MELVQPIRFSKHIQPSCLTSDVGQKTHENELATVSGWGWTNENQGDGDRPDALHKASVRVWNNNVCQQSYQLYGRPKSIIADTQMCAGYENGGIDSCWVNFEIEYKLWRPFLTKCVLCSVIFFKADSGGPLMSKDNLLMGVVSTGIGCARPGLPGIYTRVSKYLQWMESVIFS